MYKLITTFLVTLILSACSKHSDHFGENDTIVTFSDPEIVLLPDSFSYAHKRKVVDYNCDGIEDVIEVNDEKFGFGEDWQGGVILGLDTVPLSFENKKTSVKLPHTTGFTHFKIDSAYVNDDHCGDIIFTEYISNVNSYGYKASIAINQNASGEFLLIQNEMKEVLSLEETVIKIITSLNTNYGHYGKGISDYLMIDWGNFNNDKYDDLYILWRDSNDLYVTIIPVSNVSSQDLTLGESIEIEVPNFFDGLYQMRNVDLEDFNNDKYMDIVATIRNGEKVRINLALSQFEKNPHEYYVQKEQRGFGADLELFKFEKVDTFDANKDGCADYAHFGVLDGLHEFSGVKYNKQKVVVYKYSSCEKNN